MKESVILISATALLAIAVFFVGIIVRPGAVPPETRIGVDTSAPHGEPSVGIIEFISGNFPDRYSFSYAELEAALWIYAELLALGFDAAWIQPFYYRDVRSDWPLPLFPALSILNTTPFANLGLRADRGSQNVVLTLPGQSSQTIIVGAHYDGVFVPGASDNASGAALLMESASRMREMEHYYTITYVFFGAEEAGLFGAWYYASSINHDDVIFMINADVLLEGPYLFYMAGYDTAVSPGESADEHWDRISSGINGFGSSNFRPGANDITEAWGQLAQEVSAEHGFELFSKPLGIFGPSDQLSFLPFGHTVMFLNALEKTDEWHERNGEFNSWWDFMSVYSDMMRVVHTQEDCFDYIDAAWPGKMEENMRGFMLFLEAILLEYYGGGF